MHTGIAQTSNCQWGDMSDENEPLMGLQAAFLQRFERNLLRSELSRHEVNDETSVLQLHVSIHGAYLEARMKASRCCLQRRTFTGNRSKFSEVDTRHAKMRLDSLRWI